MAVNGDEKEAASETPPSSGASSYLRRFRNTQDDLTLLPDGSGRKRLSSALFVSDEVSVDDGDKCSVEACAARGPGLGVAGVPKALVGDLRIAVHVAAEPGNDAHCLLAVGDSSSAKKRAKKLARAARVLVQIEGVVVLDGPQAQAVSTATTAALAPSPGGKA